MCTLSFYPKPNQDGFILTFNRDEAPARSTIEIVADTARDLVYPKDALHGGTWFAFSRSEARFSCLLNGAFKRHERQLPYRKSRGWVVLESFDYADPLDFCENYNLENIEPFTILIGQKNQFYELKWDGEQRHIRQLDTTLAQIWSSATLYNALIQDRRASWFSEFLNKKNARIAASDLWQFHKTERTDEPENAFIMRRPSGVATVSITQLEFSISSQTIDFQYYELGKHENHRHRFTYGDARVSA